MAKNVSREVSACRHSRGHDFSRFVRTCIQIIPQFYFDLSQFNRVCNFILYIWNTFVAASIYEYAKWPLSLTLFGTKLVSSGDFSMSATFSTNLPSTFLLVTRPGGVNKYWSYSLYCYRHSHVIYVSISSNLNPRVSANVIEVQPYLTVMLLEMFLQNKRQSKGCS